MKSTIMLEICFASFSSLLFCLSGEKKYQCSICGMSFRQKAHLVTHTLIHTGEKKLKCQYCGKMFARKSDIKQHMVLHSQEKQVWNQCYVYDLTRKEAEKHIANVYTKCVTESWVGIALCSDIWF